MSENFLRFIPSSPFFVPDEGSIRRAIEIIAKDIPLTKNITFEIYNSPRFIDQGANWERVLYPNCGSLIDPDWWQAAMDHASDTNFKDLSIKIPCCGLETTLNDLCYEWPAGFAQFKIEVRNPGMDISESCFHQLESVLGKPVRKIWAHY